MEQQFADYLDRLEALHQSLGRLLEGLSSEVLDWSPGADMNSLAVLLTHTARAERYWIGAVAGQLPSDRIRADEFEAKGVTAAHLQAELDAALAESQAVLQALSGKALGEVRQSPLHDRPFTVAWALAHALEHTALHTGHAEITRQLWDQGRH